MQINIPTHFSLSFLRKQQGFKSSRESGSLLATNIQSLKIVTSVLQPKDLRLTSRLNFTFHLLGKIIQLHKRYSHCYTDEMQMNLAPRSAGPRGLAAVDESHFGHKPKLTLCQWHTSGTSWLLWSREFLFVFPKHSSCLEHCDLNIIRYQKPLS